MTGLCVQHADPWERCWRGQAVPPLRPPSTRSQRHPPTTVPEQHQRSEKHFSHTYTYQEANTHISLALLSLAHRWKLPADTGHFSDWFQWAEFCGSAKSAAGGTDTRNTRLPADVFIAFYLLFCSYRSVFHIRFLIFQEQPCIRYFDAALYL